MEKELHIGIPLLKNKELDRQVRHGRFELVAGAATEEEIAVVTKIVKAAQKIAPVACEIGQKDGFLLAISKRKDGFPTFVVQIGNVNEADETYGRDGKRGKYTDFAIKKVEVLKENQSFISSGENLREDVENHKVSMTGIAIPGGAVALRDWNIGVSAFKDADFDTVTALMIGFGSKLIPFDEAEHLAHRIGVTCLDMFVKYEYKFTAPFLSKDSQD